jgi:hypothetical protein
MAEIIEDEISRTREHRKYRQNRLARLKELNAPQILIDHEATIAEMSYGEYQVYMQELALDEKKIKQEYYKSNPPKKEVVDSLYNAFEKFKTNEKRIERLKRFPCQVCFNSEFDPLKYMSESDFEMDVYQPILDSFLNEICET